MLHNDEDLDQLLFFSGYQIGFYPSDNGSLEDSKKIESFKSYIEQLLETTPIGENIIINGLLEEANYYFHDCIFRLTECIRLNRMLLEEKKIRDEIPLTTLKKLEDPKYLSEKVQSLDLWNQITTKYFSMHNKNQVFLEKMRNIKVNQK